MEVNHHLSLAGRDFNKLSANPMAFDLVKRREYFWTKASLARNLKTAFLSLKMVNLLQKDAPFLTSSESGVFQFTDLNGAPVSFSAKTSSISLKGKHGEIFDV